VGEFEGDVCSAALTKVCTGRDGSKIGIRVDRERIAEAVVVRKCTVHGSRHASRPLHKSR
jgi:hypothetical protein